MNIIIYKGIYAYDVVNYFAEGLGNELKRRGHNITWMDLSNISPYEISFYLLHNDIDLVLSFNGVNFTIENVFKKLRIPFGVVLVDHPFFHLERILTYKGNTTFYCMYDTGFMDAFEECIDNESAIAWLPHSGTELQNEEKAEKIYDLILPGSIKDYKKEEEQLINFQSGIINKITVNLYERGKDDYNTMLYQHLKDELELHGLTTDEIRNDKSFMNIFSYIYGLVDSTLRTRSRHMLIKDLTSKGKIIYHYGLLESRELINNENLISRGPIDYLDLIKEIKKSKVLLHDTPYFQNGSHERVITGMLNKTLVFSNNNNYCDNRYEDEKNIVFYNLNDLSTLNDKLDYYLNNKNNRETIELSAYEMAKSNDTWSNRADELLSIYDKFMKLSGLNINN